MNFINYIGADEVGVGDYFGGIVTCACFIDEETAIKLKKYPIQDSKKINNVTLIQIAKKILPIVQYEITNLYPKDYNTLFQKYQNAHIIKTYAHNLSLLKLQNRLRNVTYITVLDQFATSNNYEKYLNYIQPKQLAKIDIFETKAENHYLAVATASIIARYYFLKQIATLSKQTQINLPLGYNKELLNVALNKLKQLYPQNFEQEKYYFVKLHFKI